MAASSSGVAGSSQSSTGSGRSPTLSVRRGKGRWREPGLVRAPHAAATVRRVGTIEILGIRAVGRHGVLPEEQARAQPFEVDLRLEVDLAPASASDRLEDTVDYGVLPEAVARTVELESYNLLERLAGRIACMCTSIRGVQAVEVSVRKLRPPIPVHVASVGVTLKKTAAQPAEAAAPPVEQATSLA